jgi:signal transduction histidine kinase
MLMNTSAKRLRFSTFSRLRKQHIPATLAEQRDKLPENAARQAVLRVLLVCTLYVTALFFCLLMISYFLAGHQAAGARGVANGVLLLYLLVTYKLVWPRRHWVAALMLVIFYGAVAATAMWQWGINLAFSTLVMSVTISLAGILLGARFSLYAAAFLSAVTLAVQVLVQVRVHMPDVSWQQGQPSSFGEALGYCLLFVILGVVAWVFGRQIERSLVQARAAEAVVQEQKQLLAVRLKERTRKLQAVQLEEVQQLYRFAEMGQLSTALLHELANHLTALTLDIDSLGERRRTDDTIERAKESIAQLDQLVDQVRRQLRDRGEVETFDCLQRVEEIVGNLQPKFQQRQVELELTHRGTARAMQYAGDSVRFGHVVTILLTNALQAAAEPTVDPKNRRVHLQLAANRAGVIIRVSDWAGGIAPELRKQLFKPVQSTKPDGMGIGLFITKQIMSTHFKGTVSLESVQDPTVFKLVFPAQGRDDG